MGSIADPAAGRILVRSKAGWPGIVAAAEDPEVFVSSLNEGEILRLKSVACSKSGVTRDNLRSQTRRTIVTLKYCGFGR